MALLQAQPLPHTGSYNKNVVPLSLTHLSYRGSKMPATVPMWALAHTHTALSQEGPCGSSGSDQFLL